KRTSPDTIPISKKSFMPTEIPVIRKRTFPIADEGINGFGGFGSFGGLGGFGGLGLLPLAGGFGAVPLTPFNGGFGGAIPFGAI
ncbi:6358_t:CDS:1, partial [Dentiscutata heterogama]